jgi:hypothetical protein
VARKTITRKTSNSKESSLARIKARLRLIPEVIDVRQGEELGVTVYMKKPSMSLERRISFIVEEEDPEPGVINFAFWDPDDEEG